MAARNTATLARTEQTRDTASSRQANPEPELSASFSQEVSRPLSARLTSSDDAQGREISKRSDTTIGPSTNSTDRPHDFVQQAARPRRGARRKTCLLFLDGGGIRGISTLKILQRLMEQIKKDGELAEVPRPCEYFSLIGGTSTGGIIAIMLGRLKMSVKECLKAYTDMAERAFTPAESRWPWWLQWLEVRLPAPPKGEFSGESLANAVRAIVQKYADDKEAVFAEETCVKTVVLAATKVDVGGPPTRFKTYDIDEDFEDCKIWEIARATSAATTFFPSIACGHSGIEFIDAGFGHNNPSEELLREASEVFQLECHEFDCIVSIGTGLGKEIDIKNTRMSIIKALSAMASNSYFVHRRLEDSLPEDTYFRFDVAKGLVDVTLSDHRESSKIAGHTRNYLAEYPVDRRINQCAWILGQG